MRCSMVGIVSDTYDIAGNAVDLLQSNAIEYYDRKDTPSVTVERRRRLRKPFCIRHKA